ANPESQDIRAGLRDDLLGFDGVADRFRHLAAILVEREPMREHAIERRAAAGAATLQQRRLEPAAVLVRALQIHHGVFAAVDLALDAGKAWKMFGVFQHKSMRRT